ncbi:MAG: hypothetical protein LLG44_04960 [Chloroflexi bacterium]|nr:hypothetical protein [Chloroflexota bacterium]
MSIIDTLTAAYSKLAKKIWLIVIPIGLDIFIWLGPKVSIAPWIKQLFSELQLAIQSAVATAQTGSSEMLSQTLSDMQGAVESLNMTSLLAWGRVGVPSVAGILPIKSSDPWVITVSTDFQLIMVSAVLLAVGLLIACIFMGLIKQALRGEKIHLGEVLKHAPTHWLNLVIIYLPLTLILSVAIVLSMVLGPFAFIIGMGILWILLYLYFVPQAVILGDASPMEALRSSFIIVRTNFWPSLGFVLLTSLISAGFALIWNQLIGSPVGVGASIALNALVGTGLLMASCVFYQDRLEKWYQLQQQAKVS